MKRSYEKILKLPKNKNKIIQGTLLLTIKQRNCSFHGEPKPAQKRRNAPFLLVVSC